MYDSMKVKCRLTYSEEKSLSVIVCDEEWREECTAKKHKESFGNEEIFHILIGGVVSWVYITVKFSVFTLETDIVYCN